MYKFKFFLKASIFIFSIFLSIKVYAQEKIDNENLLNSPDFKGLDTLFNERQAKEAETRKKAAKSLDEASKKNQTRALEKAQTQQAKQAEEAKQDKKATSKASIRTEEIYITGVKEKSESFSYNILNKDSKTLDRQMVTDIRDLTKYDPGISINETSQGTSSGFSMRGVDRNRVSISVDGLSQAQSFSPSGSFYPAGAFGGAINEMEVENVKAVSIQKGASSVVAGNGSLGGAVMYVTKDAFDIIKPGKKYGINLKAGYTSKDLRHFTSLAMAGIIGKMDVLFINTYRQGRELQPYSSQAKPQRLDYYNDLSFDTRKDPLVNSYASNLQSSVLEPYNVWGPTRELANPMFYKSNTSLVKLGFEITPEHYLTGIFEHSKQDFDLVDMSEHLFPYWNKYTDPYGANLNKIVQKDNNQYGTGTWRYLTVNYQTNKHKKVRYGLQYKFTPLEVSKITPDNLTLGLDYQDISMLNFDDRRHCSKSITKDCWPTLQGQYAWHNETGTREQNIKLELNMDKTFDLATIIQNLQMKAGIEYGTFGHKSQGYREAVNWIANTKNPLDFYLKPPVGLQRTNATLEPIIWQHSFFSLNDTISVSNFEILAGLRSDFYLYRSNNRYVKGSNYFNLSWHIGLVYKPLDYLEIGYIASSGFKMPSTQQLYDLAVTYPGDQVEHLDFTQHTMTQLKPEQALNHEFGITFDYRIGTIKASVFVADYKDLIAPYWEKDKNGNLVGFSTYKNVQDTYTAGIDFNLMLDWNEIARVMPQGLRTSLSFSLVRPRKYPKTLNPDSKNFVERNFVMDTLQPAKIVLGISYDSPSQVWGVDAMLVHSASKNSDELKELVPGVGMNIAKSQFLEASKSWTRLDLTAWLNLFDKGFLRFGVFNLFNTHYITWESLRQTGIVGISTTQKPNIAYQGINRLSASGINFSLVLELKF